VACAALCAGSDFPKGFAVPLPNGQRTRLSQRVASGPDPAAGHQRSAGPAAWWSIDARSGPAAGGTSESVGACPSRAAQVDSAPVKGPIDGRHPRHIRRGTSSDAASASNWRAVMVSGRPNGETITATQVSCNRLAADLRTSRRRGDPCPARQRHHLKAGGKIPADFSQGSERSSAEERIGDGAALAAYRGASSTGRAASNGEYNGHYIGSNWRTTSSSTRVHRRRPSSRRGQSMISGRQRARAEHGDGPTQLLNSSGRGEAGRRSARRMCISARCGAARQAAAQRRPVEGPGRPATLPTGDSRGGTLALCTIDPESLRAGETLGYPKAIPGRGLSEIQMRLWYDRLRDA